MKTIYIGLIMALLLVFNLGMAGWNGYEIFFGTADTWDIGFFILEIGFVAYFSWYLKYKWLPMYQYEHNWRQ